MNLPLVSIIVPSYNQGSYLEECLQSVLEQSYNNWECVIINDGSTDNTEEIALKWNNKDKRFKYIYQENIGVSAARNKAIENAKGTLILPLDGDDKIDHKYVEFGVKIFLDNPNVDLVYCNAEYFGICEGPCILPPFDREKILLGNMILNCALYKKESWKEVGGYDIKMKDGYEDWEFWISLVLNKQNFNVVKLDYVGFYYRRKEVSRDVYVSNNIKIAKKLVRYIERKHFKYFYVIILKKITRRIVNFFK
ncbi:hypothetical protein SDC9_93617 [bioreactor metagenome]|uniref:Glycosyltransferase 2-like domain-containing protein n=1 Tax=bioreactor metagenome TaxID=1076179 RepID=A0A645A133_9ZZZZ